MTAQHAAPRRRPAWRAELTAWLRHPVASVSLWLAYWEWPVYQAHTLRQFKRADRKAFAAEMAALAGRDEADGPGGPLEHLPSCDEECGGWVAHVKHLDDGWCPCCYCAQFAVTPKTPAAVSPCGVPDAPATPQAGAEAPVPATPPGPGTSPGRDRVVYPPSGRHVTAAPRMVPVDNTVPLRRVPAQRTATRPNPAYRPLPLVRVPPWLVVLRDDHGVERYRMADAGRYLRARNAARTATG